MSPGQSASDASNKKGTRTRPRAAGAYRSRGKGEGFVTLAAIAFSALAGCVSPKQPEPSATYSPSEARGVLGLLDDRPSRPDPEENQASSAPAAPSGPARQGRCAALDCTFFHRAESALAALVAERSPSILAFGEAHAQEGTTGKSTALRFGDELLPALAPQSHFLLVELIAAPSGCGDAKEKVQSESDKVTEGQSKENQNDYIALGHRSKALGVPVDILRPSCGEFETIAADPEPVFRMMTLIAELSAKVILDERAKAPPHQPLILTYGGALHNDLEPRPGFEPMSFGPALVDKTGGRYVEIDLVLAEGLGESAWARLPWFEALRAAESQRQPHETALIQRGPASYALLLTADRSAAKEPTNELQQ